MSKPFYFRINGPSSFGSYPFTVDIGSKFKTWLDTRTPPDSTVSGGAARSLAISLSADEDKNVKDKIFLDAVPHASAERMDVVESGNLRYVSFDFMLDKNYEDPRNWVIHFQAWQCCSGHPPLVIEVSHSPRSDKKIGMALAIANDETEKQHYGQRVVLAEFAVSRNEWTHVVLALEPRPCSVGTGSVRGWVNRLLIVDWHGCWGFAPMTYSPISKGQYTSHIGLDFGVYRPRQTTRQTIYLDNIVYGKTLESVKF